ncbi:oxidoreductase [Brachybacterium endophyticum]|uniref:Oxidoreductase n=1 Tax=Brachybacterium endophyticum TaxID=2182385 RepID=A0A2U2RJ84_9MICO|nr:oxidoreductase [Brachybacterium endophyticum]PWH05939.1 oxidoreductase [Brachybacterium endophyticum]
MTTFTRESVPDQTGRTIIVTGANSGIGRQAAQVLADRGARVILAVRSIEKGQAAAATMRGDVEVRRLDLSDLASVRSFAQEAPEVIDVLINNAGVMVPPYSRTTDGFELQMGTNHFGHFALTNLLLDRITDRIVTVSSMGHRFGRIDFEDLDWKRRSYRPMRAYGQSKLANLLFTAELQRRLTASGSSVIAVAAHPGAAATNLLRIPEEHKLRARVAQTATRLISQSEEDGALPSLFAAVGEIPGNSYAGPGGLLEQQGTPVLVGRSARARDPEVAKRLWTVSEERTGVTFPALTASTR